MCGIVGYVGPKCATPILIDGLRRLEYRGYDSAGICIQEDRLKTVRCEGKINDLNEKVIKFHMEGTVGIAHTRWATHGIPEERNAHPHRDCIGEVAIVHNGIIENYRELKRELSLCGHVFQSDTDSEVLAHLIEDTRKTIGSGVEAVRRALQCVRGTYGLAVVFSDLPQTIIVARMGSPLVIGVGEGEMIIASDASAIVEHTKDVIFLDDGELAVVTSEAVSLSTLDADPVDRVVERLLWDIDVAKKEGNPHFMLKEILEQPSVIEHSCMGRIDLKQGTAILGGLSEVQERLKSIQRIIIVGCGSAFYAGQVGEYIFEDLAGIPVEVELGSEFRYRKPIITANTAVLAISQSGETADTLEAVREAKRKNALTLGVVNVVGSSIARETDAGVYNHAGPEIGVASTKAFVSQLVVLTLMAIHIGRLRNSLSKSRAKEILNALTHLPEQVQQILGKRKQISDIAKNFSTIQNCLFLGRKFQAPIAYEGALKMKEVSYVHAEGYSSGEMKHGPIALIDSTFPSIVFCPRDSVFEKTWSNIEELKARGGQIVAITTPSEELLPVDFIIEIPETFEVLQPILSVIPSQLLAYEMATQRHLDPDKPRNLAKSVTVE